MPNAINTTPSAQAAPVITSSATASVAENTTAVMTVTATDSDSPSLTYRITGGTDGALFRIDQMTGELSFIEAPDFEAPADFEADNSYQIDIVVSDGVQQAEQSVVVQVTDANDAPEIVANFGADAVAISLAENRSFVSSFPALDPDPADTLTYSIGGGADAALFAIDPVSGALSFVAAPDFEAPADADHDNIYQVVVSVSDGALTDTQAVTLAVGDIADNTAPAPRFGEEFLINTITSGAQSVSSIAGFPDGRFVVAWTDDSQSSDDPSFSAVRAQVFGADGSRLGTELRVNTTTVGDQSSPAVATLADGRFVVTWAHLGLLIGDKPAIHGQIFNLDGSKSGAEFTVDAPSNLYHAAPAITGLAGGGFVATWVHDAAGSAISIHAQVFAADGVKAGAEISVNTAAAHSGKAPVTTLPDGRFVIGWTDTAGDGSAAVRARVFHVDGTPQGAALTIATTADGAQGLGLATLADGRLVATWQDATGDNVSNTDIHARIFAADGTTSGPSFRANTTTFSPQWDGVVTSLIDGRFVVAWTDTSASGDEVNGFAIRAQVFNPDGSRFGTEFVANTTFIRHQYQPVITALADGRFMVAWNDTSFGEDGSETGVRGQIFDARDAAVNLSGTQQGDDFIGTGFGDVLNSGNGNDHLRGGGGDDTLGGGNGNDLLDGGDGVDTVSYSGPISAYTIIPVGDGYQVSGGPESGTDILMNVEFAAFSDGTVTLPQGQPPEIGGGDAATVTMQENSYVATTVVATDPDNDGISYWIAGGADAALFVIDAETGTLAFVAAPDYETPADADHDNSYEVVVRATDGNQSDEQAISVTVTDRSEQSSPAVKYGEEFLVNTSTEGYQDRGSLAAFTSGQFVAVWADVLADNTPNRIVAQLFDAHGTKVGGEIPVNSGEAQAQGNPVATTLSDGRFVVAWQEYRGEVGFGLEIRAQLFNADGSRSGGEFAASTPIWESGETNPTIARLGDDRFMIAWTVTEPSRTSIRGQLFEADCTRIGGDFQVNTTDADADFPAVAGLAGDRYVVAWLGGGVDGSDGAVCAQIYLADGSPAGGEFIVNTSTAAFQDQPSITPLTGGRFVIAWTGNSANSADPFASEVRAQVFDQSGNKLGVEFVANTTTASYQSDPAVAALPDGNFVIAWSDGSTAGDDSSGYAIVAQLFDPNGAKIGGEFTLNSTTELDQLDPTVTALADGRFVVGWTDSSASGDDPSGDAVRGQIFDARAAAVHLTGTARADDFVGTAFDDTMQGNGSNGLVDDPEHDSTAHDHLDGAGGDDTAIFAHSHVHYALQANGSDVMVWNTFDGIEVLSNFEHVVFDDVALDLAGWSDENLQPAQIVSNGGGAAATISVSENITTVTTVSAVDPDLDTTITYAIAGGADAGRFVINATTGALAFAAAPDFEAPADSDHDNSYVVKVTASDGNWTDTQTLTVKVTDVDEAPTGQQTVWLIGTPGNDTFAAPAGNARIDALGAIDTVSFNFKLTEATVSYAGNQVIIDSAASHTVLTGVEVFAFTDGTVHNDDGSPLVDDLFYYSRSHDVWEARVDADAHYHTFGWHEGRDPSAFFSTRLNHSLYQDTNGLDPLVHFDQFGWTQGRLPAAAFDGAAYLAANPDVAAAQVDPLYHFLLVGAGEGRQPFAADGLFAANGFDSLYYLAHNPDVAAAHVDPLWHFQTLGWHEGRDPNALFDTAGYLNAYADVAAAGINPLDHYNLIGWHEGRDPSVGFDTTAYLAANPDVAAAHVNPLTHYLVSAIHEGRSPMADGMWG